MFIKLRIVAKVSPGLGALWCAEDAGDVQVGGAKVPGMLRIEVEPEGVELVKEAII